MFRINPHCCSLGARLVGITPAANLEAVIVASTIFAIGNRSIGNFSCRYRSCCNCWIGYVPERSPPAAPEAGKLVGITPAASFAAVTDPSAILGVVIAFELIVGFGYVPINPHLLSTWCQLVGITPAANLEAVIVASTIFALVTEASAILVVVTVPAAMVGLGYVPERSPPAAPEAGNL
jgi:hypothetical protein